RRSGERGPVLRCRPVEHVRHRTPGREGDPRRGTRGGGGPRAGRKEDRAPREPRAEPGVRRDASEVRNGVRHSARGRPPRRSEHRSRSTSFYLNPVRGSFSASAPEEWLREEVLGAAQHIPQARRHVDPDLVEEEDEAEQPENGDGPTGHGGHRSRLVGRGENWVARYINGILDWQRGSSGRADPHRPNARAHAREADARNGFDRPLRCKTGPRRPEGAGPRVTFIAGNG